MKNVRIIASLSVLVVAGASSVIVAGEHWDLLPAVVSEAEASPASDLTLLQIPNRGEAGVRSAISEVRSNGGYVAVATEEALLAWLPDSAATELRSKGVVVDRASEVGRARLLKSKMKAGNSRELADYFIDVANGNRFHEPPQRISYAGDYMPPMDPSVNIEDVSSGSEKFTATSLPGCRYNNCYMTSTVAVAAFFVESCATPGCTENRYSWTSTDIGSVKTWMNDAFVILSNNARNYGSSLTFRVRYYQPIQTDTTAPSTVSVQPYEPVIHPGLWEHNAALWVNPIMANLGYVTGATSAERVKYFNTQLKSELGASRVFSAFFTYNPPAQNAPTLYTDGGRGWSLLGGSYLQILFNNGSPFNLVFAHEIVHQFWACDEYNASLSYCSDTTACSLCYSVGPRPLLTNANCEATTCNTNPERCLMRWFISPYSMCLSTARQVGWQ